VTEEQIEMWREIAMTLVDRIVKLCYQQGWGVIATGLAMTARDIRFRIECEELRNAHG